LEITVQITTQSEVANGRTAFRFSMGIHSAKSRTTLQDKAKRYEDVGFDALHLPDHLGAPAPFPVLTAIASATSTVRLGTYVLNAGFYKPALLARDAAEVDQLSGPDASTSASGPGTCARNSRLPSCPTRPPASVSDHLEHLTTYMKKHLPKVPILIAGNGNRLLTIAAQHADIIGLTGASSGDAADPLADRIEFVRKPPPDRFADL